MREGDWRKCVRSTGFEVVKSVELAEQNIIVDCEETLGAMRFLDLSGADMLWSSWIYST